MVERLILQTHYQLGRPGILSVLVNSCTSPTESAYVEAVAKKLQASLRTLQLNPKSALLGVRMAQEMGFLTANCFWGERGHVVFHVSAEQKRTSADAYLMLSAAEKILYLKYYLQADGAALLGFCRRLMQTGSLSLAELLSTPIAEGVFIWVWETYRVLTSDIRQKVSLRQRISRLNGNPYTPKTRVHKTRPHLDCLVDLGLVDRVKEQNEVAYRARVVGGWNMVGALVESLHDIQTMEARLAKGEEFDVVASVYGIAPRVSEVNLSELRESIVDTYYTVRAEPTGLASIRVIADIVGCRWLAKHGVVVGESRVKAELEQVKAENAYDVHFHVNKQGERTFVVVSGRMRGAGKKR